ncbi:uncharacterized protein LOC119611395 [Lucilia sericata]|uniref:uncharacterized protein LOC119611395 n=1 Tax=Lucilia sericata TaxID=13632 RepID=UPI0018A8261D|nr:uncharacterized protein LOC119611395 [Lucilia sericata]
MSIYNDDELVAPSWINKEFLHKVLSEYEHDDDIEIVEFDMSPASLKGDHYASIMFRCKVTYKFCKTSSVMKRSMIIKTLPVEENMKREILMQSRLFETEIDMYSRTLPKIEKILADCGEPTRLSAEIIYHSLEPHKVIILEDLCEAGYDTVRGRFLSEDEIKAVYRKIAKFHAVSYMLGHSENEHDREEVTKYQDGIFSTSMAMQNDLMANGIKFFLDMLSQHEEFKVYYDKVKAMQPKLAKTCKELYTAYKNNSTNLNCDKGDIYVLNHGDFHMKNLMFKFSKKNHMEDLIMVDYQISCYAPSNIDIIYSQYMMLSSELRLKRHELSQYYFEEFLKMLKKIGYRGEMPLFSNFQISGIKYRHFAIFLLSTFLPMVVGLLGKSMDELKDTDTKQIFENPNAISMVYHTPAFINEIRQFMPILLNEGYLD